MQRTHTRCNALAPKENNHLTAYSGKNTERERYEENVNNTYHLRTTGRKYGANNQIQCKYIDTLQQFFAYIHFFNRKDGANNIHTRTHTSDPTYIRMGNVQRENTIMMMGMGTKAHSQVKIIFMFSFSRNISRRAKTNKKPLNISSFLGIHLII